MGSPQSNTPEQHAPIDNTIMPLTIFCIILSFVGVIAYFLPIIEAYGHNYSTGAYYTLSYEGLWLMLSSDFDYNSIYPDFPVLARFAPGIILLLYIFLMYQFYRCFNHLPSNTIPICGIFIIILSYYISFSAAITPAFTNSYIDEYLVNGIGNMIFFWDSIAIMIIGFFLNDKMKRAGFKP